MKVGVGCDKLRVAASALAETRRCQMCLAACQHVEQFRQAKGHFDTHWHLVRLGERPNQFIFEPRCAIALKIVSRRRIAGHNHHFLALSQRWQGG